MIQLYFTSSGHGFEIEKPVLLCCDLSSVIPDPLYNFEPPVAPTTPADPANTGPSESSKSTESTMLPPRSNPLLPDTKYHTI